MKYDVMQAGDVVLYGNTDDITKTYSPKKNRVPRIYELHNTEANDDIYKPLLDYVDDTVIFEADVIKKGLFKIDLEKDVIILTEVFE